MVELPKAGSEIHDPRAARVGQAVGLIPPEGTRRARGIALEPIEMMLWSALVRIGPRSSLLRT